MDSRQCLICGSGMRDWLKVPADWRRIHASELYQLSWCERCQFGQLAPRPNQEMIAKFYHIEDYYTHSADGQGQATSTNLLARLRKHLAWRVDRGLHLTAEWFTAYMGKQSLRVCELGCGSGALLEKLSSLGHDVVGVEPDPAARRVAVERGLRVLEGTAESMLPFATEAFDVVIMSHVLEHCRDPIQAVRNASSLLIQGGMLVIETPNNAAIGLQKAGVTWYWLDVPRHLNFFTTRSLRLICESQGLKSQDIEFCGYTRQFSEDWIDAEQKIREQFKSVIPKCDQLPKPNSHWQAWVLLLDTIFARPEAKYDSVRLVAVHR